MYPPFLTRYLDLESIKSCFFASSIMLISLFLISISGFFCINPDALHGASISTQSYFSFKFISKKFLHNILVLYFNLLRFSLSLFVLLLEISIEVVLNPFQLIEMSCLLVQHRLLKPKRPFYYCLYKFLLLF